MLIVAVRPGRRSFVPAVDRPLTGCSPFVSAAHVGPKQVRTSALLGSKLVMAAS